MTDWKTISKIDAHIHLMPEDVIQANPGSHFADFGSLEEYQKIMEKYHIEHAIVMPFNDPYMLSMDHTVKSVHKNLLSICGRSNSAIFAFADIDPWLNLKETLLELEEVMKNDAFIGIKIHPTNAGYPVDGSYYMSVFQWAEMHEIPVEIHSYPREHMKDDVCSPLRIKKIVRAFPKLKVSVAHLGGFQYEELIDCPVYLNLSAVLTDLAHRYGIKKTNEILRRYDTKRLVFATDYPDNRRLKPTEIYERYFNILNALDYTQEEVERICKYNILEMLGK